MEIINLLRMEFYNCGLILGQDTECTLGRMETKLLSFFAAGINLRKNRILNELKIIGRSI